MKRVLFHFSCIHLLILGVVLPLTMSCTKPDRSEEAQKLKNELQQMAFTTPEKAFARIDSAERVGLFSPAQANLNRTNFYGQMGQTRLAIFYGEQIVNVPELKREGAPYYSALLLLIGWLERTGEYGKVLRLCDEIIADVEHEREQGGGISGISEEVALRVKSSTASSSLPLSSSACSLPTCFGALINITRCSLRRTAACWPKLNSANRRNSRPSCS